MKAKTLQTLIGLGFCAIGVISGVRGEWLVFAVALICGYVVARTQL